MVKIRYSELPAGLHVAVRKQGRRTVIYLLPGLTTAERRAALMRVRSSARMGRGPEFPALSLALGVGADRFRMTLRNGAAAMRGHPALLVPPIALVAVTVVFVLMSFARLPVPSHGPRQQEIGSDLRPGLHSSSSQPAGSGSARPADQPAGAAGDRSRPAAPEDPPPLPTASPPTIGADLAFEAAVAGSGPASNSFALEFRDLLDARHSPSSFAGWWRDTVQIGEGSD